ncbi:hypothetical protein J1G42_15420 [Cellulomonas sp. zg-ZUI222]|uniref:Uncharacterized protein n=1 Tax=Cellulomonas wangleii TaxID=2816956 RepID=A0ABX8D720_9CELL|nr:hypothetical protein [Cellulomonas wangleii]MBO0922212.1 hypothetical protein [Cellulomonas wangleii]MBO0925907.1 hypothetical protein [Cellulomonas wangleii]QVI63214.1 hypothetical protein KG103_04755 [Cellulomonas wangleii]
MAVGRRTRGRVLVAAAVVTGGLLAGCSTHPGDAALVDGRAITTAELATAFEEMAPILQGVAPQNVLGILITEPFATELAAEQGAGVSDQQALDLLRTVAERAVGPEEAAGMEFGPGAVAIARYSLALAALQDAPDPAAAVAEYQARVLDADIEVNPRFGEFTIDLGVVPPEQPSWIVPAGGLEAAPADEPALEPVPTP